MSCSKVVQVNKQVMKVNIAPAGKRIQRPKFKRRSRFQRIAGRIFQMCSDEAKEYFTSVRLRPRAMIQIENKSSCTMYAIVDLGRGRIIRKTIEREQQISIYVPSIKSLGIQCDGENNIVCRGYYSLCLL